MDRRVERDEREAEERLDGAAVGRGQPRVLAGGHQRRDQHRRSDDPQEAWRRALGQEQEEAHAGQGRADPHSPAPRGRREGQGRHREEPREQSAFPQSRVEHQEARAAEKVRQAHERGGGLRPALLSPQRPELDVGQNAEQEPESHGRRAGGVAVRAEDGHDEEKDRVEREGGEHEGEAPEARAETDAVVGVRAHDRIQGALIDGPGPPPTAGGHAHFPPAVRLGGVGPHAASFNRRWAASRPPSTTRDDSANQRAAPASPGWVRSRSALSPA